ncbi:MAG: hypothetical protein EHM24_15090 [Acidobacteria bacterium]|nr:MAG: hypothetical protein EHM24_15090 [Acidobacteriota bacterium]
MACQDLAAEHRNLAMMVEGILDVLQRHEADPNEGALSLLTAFMQAADRVLELSTPEETEHNRAALVSMVEHAQQFIAAWPHRTPDSWRVH